MPIEINKEAAPPSDAKVPVDPKNPERPIDLLPKAVQYLVDEIARLDALASDAVRCRTAYAGGALAEAFAARVAAYRQKGLLALINIVNDVVRDHGGGNANGNPAASN